jgi:hypothetical protein
MARTRTRRAPTVKPHSLSLAQLVIRR